MREIRPSGSEGGAGPIPVPTPISVFGGPVFGWEICIGCATIGGETVQHALILFRGKPHKWRREFTVNNLPGFSVAGR
jgi:hypothetical protein